MIKSVIVTIILLSVSVAGSDSTASNTVSSAKPAITAEIETSATITTPAPQPAAKDLDSKQSKQPAQSKETSLLDWFADWLTPLSGKSITGLFVAFITIVIARIIIPLIIHMYSSFIKKRKVLKMIIVDVNSRIQNLERGATQLKQRIDEYKDFDGSDDAAKQKEPFLISMGDTHEVFEIKADKWDIPSFAFLKTYQFYSLHNDAASILDAIHEDRFKELPKEKKLATYLILVQRWEELVTCGRDTVKSINRNGLSQLGLDFAFFIKSLFKAY